MIIRFFIAVVFIANVLICDAQLDICETHKNEFVSVVDSLYAIEAYDQLSVYLNSTNVLEISTIYPEIELKRIAELAYLEALNESFQKSLINYKAAIKLALNLQDLDSILMIDIYYYGAYVSNELGDTELSIRYLKQLVRLTTDKSMVEDNALALNGLANIYLKKSDYDNALFYQKQALQLYELLDVPQDLARVLDDLSLILYFKTAYAEAAYYSNLALDFIADLDDDLKISVLNNAGLIKLKLGKTKIANDYFEKAFELLKRSNNKYLRGITNFNLGFSHLEKSNYDISEKYFDKAILTLKQLSSSQNLLIGKAYYYLGILYQRSNQLTKALSSLELGVSYLLPDQKNNENDKENQFSYSDRDLVRCYHQMANVLELMLNNDNDKIINLYELAVKRIKIIRRNYESEASKLFLAKEAKSVYDSAIEYCYQLHSKTSDKFYLSKAHYFVECAQSPLLLRNSKQHHDTLGGIPVELVRTQREALLDIAYFQKQLNNKHIQDSALIQLNRRYLLKSKLRSDSINLTINKDYPKYFNDINSSFVVEIKDLQSILRKDELLVQYYQSNDHIYRFDISKQHVGFIKIKESISIKDLVDKIMDHLKRPNSNMISIKEFIELGTELYDRLLPKLEEYQSLVIVPSGFLYQLPFDILLSEVTKAQQYIDLPYLINSVSINYQPSSAIFYKFFENEELKSPSILAISPFTESSKVSSHLVIPNTQDEVEKCLEFYPGKLLANNEATKIAIFQNMNDHDILHFATHGMSDTIDFSNAKLLLSCVEEAQDDCDLFSYEIQNSSFSNSLVVLSACESGLGEINSGEGTMSMAKAFLYGGVPSVVMTRWQVNDKSATLLMPNFYKNLKLGINKDEALRLAKQEYLDNYADNITAHPYYWSSFSQIGSTAAYSHESNTFIWLSLSSLLIITSLILLIILKRN